MRLRFVPAAAVTALLLAGATGCSPSSPAESCGATLAPGALSDAVTVTGDFGSETEIDVPEGTEILTSQRTVAIEADERDRVAEEGMFASVGLSYFNGETGENLGAQLGRTADRGGAELPISEETPYALTEALRCAAPGDRLVVAMEPEESSFVGGQLGLEPGAPMVAVVDVIAVGEMRAEGAVKNLPWGFPGVVTDESGRPGIVLPPSQGNSEEARSATRVVGEGIEVQADDDVIANVLIVDWEGQVVANTWDSGVLPLGTEETAAQSGATFRPELTGQTVGSQVVTIEPGASGQPQVVVTDIIGVR